MEEVNTIASTFDKYIQYQSNQDNWTNDTLQLNIRVFKLLNMYFKDKNLKDCIYRSYRTVMPELYRTLLQ